MSLPIAIYNNICQKMVNITIMETTREYSGELNGKYLLVSDSNESGKQYDSKKLKHEDLADMAQDRLFKEILDGWKYVSDGQYRMYTANLTDQMKNATDSFNEVKDLNPLKLRA